MEGKEKPKIIKLSDQDLKKIQSEIQFSGLSLETKDIILSIVKGFLWLSSLYQAKKLSLNKLKRIFSFGSEKQKPNSDDINNKLNKDNDKDNKNPTANKSSGSNDITNKTKGKEKKGHGKRGHKDFPGAKQELHCHHEFNKGDQCPECSRGKLYPIDPGVLIQFTGTSAIQLTVHKTEKFRCNTCGEIFEADLPKEIKKQKYDESADVVIALQKYGLGIPFYRSEKWQKAMEIPLPSSTQWGRVEKLGDSVYPVFEKLIDCAAEGDVSFIDDTGNKILDLKKELIESKDKRSGIYTTGIVSKVQDKVINLFFTGNRHAGENINRLLERRKEISLMLLMSDALSRNNSKKFLTIWCKCLTHARRGFNDLKEDYPKMVNSILHLFGKIYHFDNFCEEKDFSPEERLLFHQKKSTPILKRMRRWCMKMLYLKKVEPNEELGGAIQYLFNHWKELTQFLRIPGAPICNNIVERLLKTAILHRKNSLFYKSELGAYVGDVIMSLIQTAIQARVNPFNYLTALHRNKPAVHAAPEKWFPWNYKMNVI